MEKKNNLGWGTGAALILITIVWFGFKSSSPNLPEPVLGEDGFFLAPVELPVNWNNWDELISSGVIDEDKLNALYGARGGLPDEVTALLSETNDDNQTITMTPDNAGAILNLLWAFGLANQNPVLTDGPMSDPRYGDPSRFASTGGWPLALGSIMDHYSAHFLVPLNEKQQSLVEEVSKNIYRPCCGNSTYFPDCNHGMAMLGLLELMAANGVLEEEMYKVALQVNILWFPDTYQTIAAYFGKRGVPWSEVDPKTVLGSDYSSSTGYQQILSEVNPPSAAPSSCGV